MSKFTGLIPGNKAPASGQYQQIGPKGGKGNEVTVSKGEIMPPTSKPGSSFSLVDASKNKAGQGR